MTSILTNPERTFINAANWCKDYEVPANECIQNILAHPTVSQIINNWNDVSGVIGL